MQMRDNQELDTTVGVITAEELGWFGQVVRSCQDFSACSKDAFNCSITLALSVTVFSMSRVKPAGASLQAPPGSCSSPRRYAYTPR